MIFISNLWTVIWIRLQFPEGQVLIVDSSLD